MNVSTDCFIRCLASLLVSVLSLLTAYETNKLIVTEMKSERSFRCCNNLLPTMVFVKVFIRLQMSFESSIWYLVFLLFNFYHSLLYCLNWTRLIAYILQWLPPVHLTDIPKSPKRKNCSLKKVLNEKKKWTLSRRVAKKIHKRILDNQSLFLFL